MIQTTPIREKRNADEGGAHAPAQVGAHAPAYAQHTNARTYRLFIGSFDRLGRLHSTRDAYKTYTHAQLVRLIADKHAKGYRLVNLVRWNASNTFDLTFDVKEWYEPYIGFITLSTRAGRIATKYAPVQEARE